MPRGQPMDGRFPELIAMARAYCALIEHIDQLPCDEWLECVALLLPCLQEAVRALPKPRPTAPLPPTVDLETRFALYRRLRQRLGERDAYWMTDDHALSGQPQSGSLADDLTDIYFDLRDGVLRLDARSPDACARVVSDWCHRYDLHWGEHLADAERHLGELMRSRTQETGLRK